MDNVPVSNGDAYGAATIVVSGIVFVLAIIAVALRFYTRIVTKAGLGWDDWLILAAVVSTLLTGILVVWGKIALRLSEVWNRAMSFWIFSSRKLTVALRIGNAVDPNGESVTDNTDPNYHYTAEDVFYLKLAFTSSVLYFTIAGSTKLSILLMYNHIFSVNRTFRRQLAIVSILVLGFWIGCTVATLTNCIPLEWSWLNGLSDARYCFNYNIFWMVAGVCEVILDVLILALPIRVILTLQLSAGRKAAIACIFLLGGFVIITGLIKVILGYVPGSRVPSYSRTELWTTIHAGMAIVCACLPIFKPLLTRLSQSTLISKLGKISALRRSYVWSRRSRRSSAQDGEFITGSEEYSSEVELRSGQIPQQKPGFSGTVERLVLREEIV
ncbi:hypothetical protein MMC14_007004 [Varicellaria rhodocarpa]|nr:hypothetical protein [Varicellaria rhodocarpa]